MKYYTATEACDTFPHIVPDDVVMLRRWIKNGKFPKHDCMVVRGNAELQAWSEYTILNWQVLAKAAKVTVCPPAFAEGGVPSYKVRPSKKGKSAD